ncbi:cysteine-rich receptor-like protein kinase 8 [Tanacetum coccineum]
MMCDNASSIALAFNHVHHARSKHIEIDCHFVKDKVKAGQILPQYISTKNQLADILTKGLNRPLHYNCLTKLGMCNPYTLPTCEGDDKAEVIQGSKHPASVTNHSPKHSIQSLQSKRSMLIALSAKNKLKLINGDYDEPSIDSPLRAYWERANDMLISWILNNVSEQIGNHLTFVNSAFSLWSELQEHYSQLDGHKI